MGGDHHLKISANVSSLVRSTHKCAELALVIQGVLKPRQVQFSSNEIYIEVLIGCDILFQRRRKRVFVGRASQHLNASTCIHHPPGYSNIELVAFKATTENCYEHQIPTGHLVPVKKS